MKILRTPDNRFEGLKDYPFSPNYTVIQTEDGSDLRIHHLDEGPQDGPVLLCMHGQPAWSYLYRKMIPLLNAAGIRVIAPDLVGFGKSDKPAAREDYSYNRQVEWMGKWLVANDFTGLTFFGQDWGGLIGLRMVAAHVERFDRVVISNTGLPYTLEVPEEIKQHVAAFWAEAPTPTMLEMASALGGMSVDERPLKFSYWQKFCWETEDLPVGLMMAGSTVGREAAEAGKEISPAELLSSATYKAYDAPYPDPSYKMGPRAMPKQVPFLPDDPVMPSQLAAWEVFETFDKPFLCAFCDDDPVTAGLDAEFLERVPGTKGQAHTTIKGGGHFVQESRPDALSEIITSFIRST